MRVFDSWWLDTKLGGRMLIKYPALALTGAIGIAVAVAIAAAGWSVVERNFSASALPFEESDRIVSIELWDSMAGRPEQRVLRDFLSWREELKSVREVSAYRSFTPNLVAPGLPPTSVRVAAISASGFGVVRVSPLLGRYLSEADERTGAPQVAVLSESLWRDRFGSDAAILGRTVQLGVTPHTIVGVMPIGFAFPIHHQLWVPLRVEWISPAPLSGPPLGVFGRLAPGATLAHARSEIEAMGQRAAAMLPLAYASTKPQVAPYPLPILKVHGREDMAGIVALQGLIVALLVLVCLNVAILVYTRTAMRQAEIGLRTALGASRARIVAQLFLEALVLSVAAALAGLVIAAVALRQLTTTTADIALPFWVSFQLTPQAALYAGALSVLAAVIIGVLPGLQATSGRLQTGLRIVGAGESGMRLGQIWTLLIVAQVGFAVALLPHSVLHAWDSLKAGLDSPGFAAEAFLSAQLGTSAPAQRGIGDFASQHAEVMRTLAADPRVSAATFAMVDPVDEPSARIEVDGGPVASHDVRFNRVDVHFFRTLGVPVLGGRGFGPEDTSAAHPSDASRAPVVVVNRALAQRVFGGQALGKHIRYVGRDLRSGSADQGPGPWHEIIGIVRDFPGSFRDASEPGDAKVYHAVSAGQVEPVALAIRMRGQSPTAFVQQLRTKVAAVDLDLYVRDVRSLDETLRKEQWIRRLEAGVLLAVTISVLLLSAAGIYALMSFTVEQRRREIGIRLALGASLPALVASIFSRATSQLVAGAAAGATLGVAFDQAFSGSLTRGDGPVVLAAVALAVVAVGLLSACGPAWRSLRMEPTQSLRER